ncbi:hypothetical protein ACQ4N7_29390 [Nodosilinea sp. AN01ver1]|uniref:hypothetical protein n=1 Tax=Nodosilinea sp. AN01ver1 TaxID=3423362 RepID=UPI003D30FB5D
MPQSNMDGFLNQVEAMLAELESALRVIDASASIGNNYTRSTFEDVQQSLIAIESWVDERRGLLAADKEQIADLIIDIERNRFYCKANPSLKAEIWTRLRRLVDTLGFGSY